MIRIVTFLTLLFLSVSAHAATLNEKVSLSGDVLTVGDVFASAENNADHVLGPAPVPGNVLILDNKTLKRIATTFKVNWQAKTGLETATVRGTKTPAQNDAQKSDAMVKIPVLAQPMNRDDVIKASDLAWIDMPARDLKEDTALKETDLIGQSPRALIQPNVPVSVHVLVSPKVIKRGDLVTLTLKAGRISLTAKGKAMEDARMDEMVRVQNPDSQKIVQARVTGPQEAIIEPQS